MQSQFKVLLNEIKVYRINGARLTAVMAGIAFIFSQTFYFFFPFPFSLIQSTEFNLLNKLSADWNGGEIAAAYPLVSRNDSHSVSWECSRCWTFRGNKRKVHVLKKYIQSVPYKCIDLQLVAIWAKKKFSSIGWEKKLSFM